MLHVPTGLLLLLEVVCAPGAPACHGLLVNNGLHLAGNAPASALWVISKGKRLCGVLM